MLPDWRADGLLPPVAEAEATGRDRSPSLTVGLLGQTGGLPRQTGGLPRQTGGLPRQTGGFEEQTGGFEEQTRGFEEQTGGLEEPREAVAGWPPGWFEATAGSITDPSFVRPPQGEYEKRDEIE